MHTSKLIRLPLALAAVALTLGAAEVWTKDSKDWTDADVQRILTSSPWAQKTAATMQSERRGDGGGFPSGSTGGGYPEGTGTGAGGMGMPGGGMGRSGGGMGMPGGGGGMGYPGGGSGRGGRNGGDGSSARNRMEVVVRWDSAAPVKQALTRSNASTSDSDNKGEHSYIVSIAGLRMPGSGDSEHLRNVLIASTQLLVKGKDPIDPEDLKIQSDSDGTVTAQFFFPRSHPIDLDDKEVTFITQTGSLKLEHKFKLKDMVYNGKLSL